jgi:sporulation protein YlmC with PRC-barrel domain
MAARVPKCCTLRKIDRRYLAVDIHIGAHVESTDGRIGEITRVVVDSRDQTLTHLVVRGQGALGVERLVPIDDVDDATADSVALRASRADFERMPPFDRTVEYTPPGIGDMYVDQIRGEAEIELDQEVIPEDEVAVRGGERVEATDGSIGHVDGVVVDPTNRKVTHFVLREGHPWHPRIVTIPLDTIDRVKHNVIYLSVSKQQIEPMAAATDI